MRKIIAAINMTLDGFCDHTAMRPDDKQMEHYNELYRNSDTELFGRVTFQLMESYWPEIAKEQSESELENEFAVLIDNIPKIVYSRTLETVDWQPTELKRELVAEDIAELKNCEGKNILVGGPSLIVQLTKLGLVDEYQICVHSTVLGSGLPLFKNITEKFDLSLLETKTFSNGAVLLRYEPVK